MAATRNLIVNLIAKSEQFEASMKRGEQSLRRFTREVAGVKRTLNTLLSFAGVSLSLGLIAGMFKEADQAARRFVRNLQEGKIELEKFAGVNVHALKVIVADFDVAAERLERAKLRLAEETGGGFWTNMLAWSYETLAAYINLYNKGEREHRLNRPYYQVKELENQARLEAILNDEFKKRGEALKEVVNLEDKLCQLAKEYSFYRKAAMDQEAELTNKLMRHTEKLLNLREREAQQAKKIAEDRALREQEVQLQADAERTRILKLLQEKERREMEEERRDWQQIQRGLDADLALLRAEISLRERAMAATGEKGGAVAYNPAYIAREGLQGDTLQKQLLVQQQILRANQQIVTNTADMGID